MIENKISSNWRESGILNTEMGSYPVSSNSKNLIDFKVKPSHFNNNKTSIDDNETAGVTEDYMDKMSGVR